jgi:hypothetical protein
MLRQQLVRQLNPRPLNLLDLFGAQPEVDRRLKGLITNSAESLADVDACVATLLFVGLFAFGAKFENGPYPSGDRGYGGACRDQCGTDPGPVPMAVRILENVW